MDLSPTSESRSPGDVLVVNRHRDAPLEPLLLEHLLEVPKLVPVADDPAPGAKEVIPSSKKAKSESTKPSELST